MLFKGFVCDRITVPSCELHNNDKAGDDQTIIHGFLKALKAYATNQDTALAIKKASSGFDYTKNTAPILPFIPKGPKFPYITADILSWMCKLTAGLVYHALQRRDTDIKWDQDSVFSSHYWEGPPLIPGDERLKQFEEKVAKQNFFRSKQWQNGWSATPNPYPTDIYSFEICTTPEKTWFKHNFYKSFEFYVEFSHTPKTSLALTKKARP